MNTAENNKLIAEFMEYPSNGFGKYICPKKDIPVDASELPYHKEWNWLMPVVESVFERLDARDTSANEIKRHLLTCNRKATHKAVVEFIKFYNENK